MTNKLIRVGIADDHEIFRDGLRMIINKAPLTEVVFEARDGKQLVEFCDKFLPDVVLTDIVMPVMDGIEAVRQITAKHPTIACMALSMFNEDSQVIDMIEAGASGYLVKNAGKEEIIEGINSIHQNKPYYCKASSATLARMISSQNRNASTFSPRPVELTDNEIMIVRLICQEKTNKEMADIMSLSTRTIEGYRIKIMDKWQVRSTAGIVVYAIRSGLYKFS
ncbi:response regulator transcription factor [Foetidibacter luteolus]|uniref:response regulator transcription factor n=1 Tax=Foetidibacter luteolus TaxID=2608880 RepID=UPI00129B878F|nr:response regulator transcription factor [Foetidibacter luteolus]